jgi:hypothetical protein
MTTEGLELIPKRYGYPKKAVIKIKVVDNR